MRPFLAVVLPFAACASDAPKTDFDSSAGMAKVVVAADGFVRLDGQRMPWEAAVLTLRQRARTLPAADLAERFVVEVSDLPQGDEDAQRRTSDAVNRLLDQLQIMGVRQVAIR